MPREQSYLLLARSLVERFGNLDDDFVMALERASIPSGTVRRFPNGAIEVDEATWDEFRESEWMRSLAEFDSIPRMESSGPFRSLGPFLPLRFYAILYLKEYQTRLRSERRLIGWRSTAFAPTPGEFEVSSLIVLVVFRTRLNATTREAFLASLGKWAAEASKRGAFEDGPVRFITQGVSFTKTSARFTIDVSRSGQDTLNWLSLAMLDFGENVHVVTVITYGHTDDEIDEKFPPARGEQTFVPFLEVARDHISSNRVDSRESYVPADAFPESLFPSVRFRVLSLPDDEWDSFVATIYLERTPTDDERGILRKLMNSWGMLCSYGGFGGVGSHSGPKLRFDDSTDSARIECDMGDTDPELALPAFIRVLEGFMHGTGTPIEAVVFGRSMV